MRYRRWQAPVVVAHSLTVPSDDTVSTKRPSGDTSAPRMGLWWPCRVTETEHKDLVKEQMHSMWNVVVVVVSKTTRASVRGSRRDMSRCIEQQQRPKSVAPIELKSCDWAVVGGVQLTSSGAP